MNQYLVQWASGAFQILTGEQLKQDLETYNKKWIASVNKAIEKETKK